MTFNEADYFVLREMFAPAPGMDTLKKTETGYVFQITHTIEEKKAELLTRIFDEVRKRSKKSINETEIAASLYFYIHTSNLKIFDVVLNYEGISYDGLVDHFIDNYIVPRTRDATKKVKK